MYQQEGVMHLLPHLFLISAGGASLLVFLTSGLI
jgi:hypothetical protein